jgi:hypothetical protein
VSDGYRLPVPEPIDATGQPRFGGTSPSPALEPSFLLLVVNKTDLRITAVRVDDGAWVRLRAPIARTCSLVDAACIAERRWVPLVSLASTGAHDVDVELVDAGGNRFRSRLAAYTPLAGHHSGVVFLGT